MADQYPKEIEENHAATKVEEEPATGCGMFDFLKKKENEKPQPEEHKHTLAEKLHHHDGSDSSSVRRLQFDHSKHAMLMISIQSYILCLFLLMKSVLLGNFDSLAVMKKAGRRRRRG